VVNSLSQKLQLVFMPVPVISLKGSLEDLYNPITGAKNTNSLFADAGIQYRLMYLHADLELSATNIANETAYKIVQLSTNAVSTTSYPLRPRIVLLKVVFNL
jgi:hypothetical protein